MAARPLAFVGKVFKGKNKDGDFKWMVKQPEYQDALFVIAENFLDSIRDDYDEGAGTAVLRPMCPQRVALGETPRAVGVPTGWSVPAMGFPFMDTVFTKTAIDLSLDRIALVLGQHPQYKRLIYSCDAAAPQLIGVKIFESTLNDAVREYISEGIHNMGSRVPHKATLKAIRQQELKLLPHAIFVSDAASRKRGRDEELPRKMGASKQTTLVTSNKRPFGLV